MREIYTHTHMYMYIYTYTHVIHSGHVVHKRASLCVEVMWVWLVKVTMIVIVESVKLIGVLAVTVCDY